ncbi:MAG TPA: hypothetical protein VGP43_08510 [Chitinophagaceae bacterium]|nr:hypothetical protein [Chitinophagaceae bacterium]
MKGYLKYYLVLLITFCYASATLEVSEKESKENFKKELTSHIVADKHSASFHQFDLKKIFFQKDINFLFFSEKDFLQLKNNITFFTNFSPPPKTNDIYLHNCVFLI